MSTEHLLSLPEGTMLPLGYVVMMHGVRESRPIMTYRRWINHIPQAYRESILAEPGMAPAELTQDDHCLALLKHHPSLMHMTMEARKPMFHLRPADGAIGAYVAAIQTCYAEFEQLARHIAAQVGVEIEPKRGYRTELG